MKICCRGRPVISAVSQRASRDIDTLYVMGFIEFADAAYKRFDEMAQLIMIDIHARETDRRRDEITALKQKDQPDLRGGIDYVDSPRHANYVETTSYQNISRRAEGKIRLARYRRTHLRQPSPTRRDRTEPEGYLTCLNSPWSPVPQGA